MQIMLEKKEVQNIVDVMRAKPTKVTQTRKNEKNNAIASKIIKQKLNVDLYINVIESKIYIDYRRLYNKFVSK